MYLRVSRRQAKASFSNSYAGCSKLKDVVTVFVRDDAFEQQKGLLCQDYFLALFTDMSCSS